MNLMQLFIFVAIVSCSATVDWVHFSQYHKVLPKPHLRIIGGNETTPHAYPFQVGLMIDGSSFCGGSLISKNFVLTAAHCTSAIRNRVQVIIGAHEIKNKNEATQVVINGEEFITHEKYNSTSFENDIALIKLAKPVELNNFIKTVNLLPKANANKDFTNERVTSIGWGLTRDVPNPSIDDISSVLMAANLTVIPLSGCEDFNNNDQHIDYVTKKNICTSGYRAKGTCEGDSGSPLMHDGKQIGLVSIGPSECEACWPSVYTHVGKFLDWIQLNSDVVIE